MFLKVRAADLQGTCNVFWGYPKHILVVPAAYLEGTRSVFLVIRNKVLGWPPGRHIRFCECDWFPWLRVAVFRVVSTSDIWEKYWVLTEGSRVSLVGLNLT